LPEPLRALVGQLSGLPGLGPKSALRMAMAMLKWPETRARDLGRAIFELRDKLCLCSQCNSLSDSDPCRLCADPARSRETLCVLAEWDSLLAMEDGGFYRGGYFILGGLLAPLDGVAQDGLELNKLRQRLRQGQIKELILGLGTTIEAENTASYLRNLAQQEFPELRVTRLAQGIPLGAEVRYIDKETLRQSLAYRQEL
jgi:recombination protein RecR